MLLTSGERQQRVEEWGGGGENIACVCLCITDCKSLHIHVRLRNSYEMTKVHSFQGPLACGCLAGMSFLCPPS